MILEIWQSKDLGRLKGRRGLLDGLCDRIGVSDVRGALGVRLNRLELETLAESWGAGGIASAVLDAR